jgi:hypothetical protein
VNPDAALSKLGIDPAQVSKGVRAEDPFLVATRLAMNGFRVLPTHARNKVPCICEWPERATTDLARLAQWKVRFHSPSWSILTGRENGVWLIDIDGAKGRADLARLESELGPLPIVGLSLLLILRTSEPPRTFWVAQLTFAGGMGTRFCREAFTSQACGTAGRMSTLRTNAN